MEITKKAFYDLVQMERIHQLDKWGEQHHTDEHWLVIALEEFGEIGKAVLENNDIELLQEICQVVAVLEAWVTSRDFFNEKEAGTEDESS